MAETCQRPVHLTHTEYTDLFEVVFRAKCTALFTKVCYEVQYYDAVSSARISLLMFKHDAVMADGGTKNEQSGTI